MLRLSDTDIKQILEYKIVVKIDTILNNLDFHTCTSIRARKVGPRSPQYGTGGEWSTQVLLGVRRVVAQRCGGRHGQTAWGPAGAGRLGLSVLCSRGARLCQCSAICGAHRTASGRPWPLGRCVRVGGEGWGWMAAPDRTAPAGREMRTISWRLLHGALHSCRRSGPGSGKLLPSSSSILLLRRGRVRRGTTDGLRRPVGCCVCLCFPISRPTSCVQCCLPATATPLLTSAVAAPRCRACAALRLALCLIPTPVGAAVPSP